MSNAFKILFLFCLISELIYAQEYNFIVAGHLYGSPYSSNHRYPSESIIANTSYIKSLKSNFFISLGDNFSDGNDSLSLKIFEESFRKNIDLPIYTAYGNHDGDRKTIENRIGSKTYYSLNFNNDLFIFLDSELNDSELNKDCLKFILKILKDAEHQSMIKNIFVFSHKLIWAPTNSRFNIVTNNSNDPKYDYKRYNFFYQKLCQ